MKKGEVTWILAVIKKTNNDKVSGFRRLGENYNIQSVFLNGSARFNN